MKLYLNITKIIWSVNNFELDLLCYLLWQCVYWNISFNQNSWFTIFDKSWFKDEKNKQPLTLTSRVSVTVRENRAVSKDRGRPLTSTFLPYKSYLKRISTVTFVEVDVLFPTRYKFSLNLGPLVTKNTWNFRQLWINLVGASHMRTTTINSSIFSERLIP